MHQRVSGLVVLASLIFSGRCVLRPPLAKSTCHHTDVASESKALMGSRFARLPLDACCEGLRIRQQGSEGQQVLRPQRTLREAPSECKGAPLENLVRCLQENDPGLCLVKLLRSCLNRARPSRRTLRRLRVVLLAEQFLVEVGVHHHAVGLVAMDRNVDDSPSRVETPWVPGRLC